MITNNKLNMTYFELLEQNKAVLKSLKQIKDSLAELDACKKIYSSMIIDG